MQNPREVLFMSITDLAEAMLPGCKIVETGIRPGEKLHEIMVTTEDSFTTYEYDKHFIVYPQMIWNNRQKPDLSGKKVEEGFPTAPAAIRNGFL